MLLKKIGYIALVVLLLLQAGGLMLIYQLKQDCIKEHMAELVRERDGQFTKLVLPLSQYNNSKIGSDELRYGGKLYDIRSVHVNGNTVELLVLVDTEETELVTKIDNIARKHTSQDDHVIYKLFELMAAAYTCPLHHAPVYYTVERKLQFAPVIEGPISRSYRSLSPPPELS